MKKRITIKDIELAAFKEFLIKKIKVCKLLTDEIRLDIENSKRIVSLKKRYEYINEIFLKEKSIKEKKDPQKKIERRNTRNRTSLKYFLKDEFHGFPKKNRKKTIALSKPTPYKGGPKFVWGRK